MSFVIDQIQRIDAALDRLATHTDYAIKATSARGIPSEQQVRVRTLIKSLAVDSTSPKPLLSRHRISDILQSSPLLQSTSQVGVSSDDTYESDIDLHWLLLSKALTQTYALVIERLLSQTLVIADDIWYWDEILTSYRYTLLYSIQISPLRLYDLSSAIWIEAKDRLDQGDVNVSGVRQDVQDSITAQWRRFYEMVRQVTYERRFRTAVPASPVARVRAEVRAKQKRLKAARLRGANALGVLLGEGLVNEVAHGDGLTTPAGDEGGRKWKASVARNVALLDAVLAKVNDDGLDIRKFDAAIAEETDEDVLYGADIMMAADVEGGANGSVHPGMVAQRLVSLLSNGFETYDTKSDTITRIHGKPSRVIRYWLPATIGILSSTTVLRILANHQADIMQWIHDTGTTIVDFWSNWVVAPTRKLISTIRHDEGSEVAIMSKRSLSGDRDSLERMVVEFARDNPGHASDSSSALTEAQLVDIREKVREGDLTPVLRAYEKDLASPFMGAVRGNLIRALLIQVQKTKVDVEVAMGGIDALLKSQELVFGFVGLTPGILVTFGIFRWLQSSLGQRKVNDSRQKKGLMIRQLRNIDRILSNATPTEFGELGYKDQGLLLCEVHILRQEARRIMPEQVYREFCQEVGDLVDVRTGVKRQRDVVGRCRWGYQRWL